MLSIKKIKTKIKAIKTKIKRKKKKFKNFLKLKIIFLLILFYYYEFEKNFFIFNTYIPKNYTLDEEIEYRNYINFSEKPLNNSDPLVIEEKKSILNYISETAGKPLKNIDKIFYSCKVKFGNIIIILNKLLFFNEIIGVKNIILDKDNFWFIKNKIYIEKYNITIEVDDIIKYNNSKSNNSIVCSCENFFYTFFKFKPEIRINYLREEILSNLPKVIISPDDLYIHIRSGDIFGSCPHYPYSQPPLCFYQRIIRENKYNNIFLLSQDKNNPVIRKLLNSNKRIVYKNNSLEYDIASLIYASNIVASVSSFLISIIQLNYNLKHLWDYNIYKFGQKIRHLHYDYYKYPNHNFTIHRMEPSLNYNNIMYFWKNSLRQRHLMIKEKCINNFTIIRK